METLLAIIDRYDWIIYIVCTAGALAYLSWALAARREYRHSIFSLEREEKMGEMRRAVLLALLFVAILGTTAYINFWVLANATGRPPVGPTLAMQPTGTPTPVIGQGIPTSTSVPEPTATPEPIIAVPTDTPSPVEETPPTPTEAAPTPTEAAPTPTEAVPTPTEAAPPPSPTPPPPPVPPASCPSEGVQISSPGNGQTVSGVVSIVGTANIENFQFYKVEYNGGSGFAVIGDLVHQPVNGGVLTSWNTAGFPSGTYTLRLTVVDVTGNYPAPCDVNVIIP